MRSYFRWGGEYQMLLATGILSVLFYAVKMRSNSFSLTCRSSPCSVQSHSSGGPIALMWETKIWTICPIRMPLIMILFSIDVHTNLLSAAPDKPSSYSGGGGSMGDKQNRRHYPNEAQSPRTISSEPGEQQHAQIYSLINYTIYSCRMLQSIEVLHLWDLFG